MVTGGYSACASACVSLNSYAILGCVRSSAVNDFIIASGEVYCGESDGHVNGGNCLYVSLRQPVGHPASDEPAGGFVWANGCETTYTNWGPNQPNDHGTGEDCVAYGWERATSWYDVQCDQNFQCFCEAPLLPADSITDDCPATDTVSESATAAILMPLLLLPFVLICLVRCASRLHSLEGRRSHLHTRDSPAQGVAMAMAPSRGERNWEDTATPVVTAAPVLTAVVVQGEPVGTSSGEPLAAGAPIPLKDMADTLRRELALDHCGNVRAVVDEACARLSVDTSGSLLTKAQRCYDTLGRR